MRQEDIDKMNSFKWYHRIDLGAGIVTPGNDWDHLWGPIKREMRKVDFTGKKVLDIGCWDGMWSFEAEKLGAGEVWATDIVSQRSFSAQEFGTLKFAKEMLKSQIHYREASIYDLDRYFGEEFDVVLCFGVVYHLRYPQLGMAQIRKVLRTGGIALVETAVLLDTQDTIIQTNYKNIYPFDVSTWNAFSGAALVALMEESYLKPREYTVILRQDEGLKIGRALVRAQAYAGKNVHHFYADHVLGKYFEPYS